MAEDTNFFCKTHEEMSKITSENVASIIRINGSINTLAERINSVNGRIDSLNDTMKQTREDIMDRVSSIRNAMDDNKELFINYIEECREYRKVRALHDKSDEPHKVTHDSPSSIKGAVVFALQRPWFWGILFGIVAIVGGSEGIKFIVTRIIGN